MEKSVYSSTQIPHPLPLPLPNSFASADESGWTAYLEDPSATATASFGIGTSSLLSDAASHAAAAAAHHHLKIPTKLSFKPKQPQLFVDTSLEDTASSPDNSPKVADLRHLDGNHCPRKSSLGNGRTTGENYRGEDERNLEMGFKRKATEYTDLKKRGLCLVPLSMLANYYLG